MKNKFILLSAIIAVGFAAFFLAGCPDTASTTYYTVTFNSNGGTAVAPLTSVAAGTTAISPYTLNGIPMQSAKPVRVQAGSSIAVRQALQ